MRTVQIGIAALLLAACYGEPGSPPELEDVIENTTSTTANGSLPGTFEVVGSDGEAGLQSVLREDGTYTDLGEDGAILGEGSWAVTEGKTCFTFQSDEGEETDCWSESEPAEDGSFTATNDDGETITVRRVGN